MTNDDKKAIEFSIWAFLVSVGALGLLDQLGVWNGYAPISSLVGISEDDIAAIMLVLTFFSIVGLHTLGRDEEYRPHSIAWKNQESESEQEDPEAEANWWGEQPE